MFGKPISEIMDETRITGFLDIILDSEVIVIQDENENEDSEDNSNINNFDINFMGKLDFLS